MRLQKAACAYFCLVLLINSTAVFAFETDQFNLPAQPLADIGDEVSGYAEQNLRQAVEKINAEIIVRENCLTNAKSAKCDSPEKDKARLAYLRSEDAVAREVFNLLGAGFPPLTRSGSWMETHRFNAQPARYKANFSDTIFAVSPSNYLTISSTVNLYGVQMGTDKIAHVFQQGYTYYKIYQRAISENLSPDAALKRAARWGRKTERTYYGNWVSGVYSNADLAANFAGMKFYQGLTRQTKIGDETRPATLRLKDGVWTFDENADVRRILKPFISEHLGEAWNPSIYTKLFGLRASVRRQVKKRSCEQWRNLYPNFSQADFEAQTQKLRLWNGEDYGFTKSDNFVTIANTCFGN